VASLSETKPYFLQKLVHQFQCGVLVLPVLDQDIANFTLGIHGAPEIDHATIDLEINPVEMAGCMWLRPAFAKIGGDPGSKMIDPSSHCFTGNRDAAFRQQILNVTEAQVEPEIKPDRLLDNFREGSGSRYS